MIDLIFLTLLGTQWAYCFWRRSSLVEPGRHFNVGTDEVSSRLSLKRCGQGAVFKVLDFLQCVLRRSTKWLNTVVKNTINIMVNATVW